MSLSITLSSTPVFVSPGLQMCHLVHVILRQSGQATWFSNWLLVIKVKGKVDGYNYCNLKSYSRVLPVFLSYE